jgi:hypothetical protein
VSWRWARICDWSRGCVDSVSVRKKGGRAHRAQPDRPRQARHEVPPARRRRRVDHAHAALTGEHPRQHAVRTCVETNPGVRGHRNRPRRPRRRPDKLHADKGRDYPRCGRYLQRRGIKVRIGRRGIESRNHLCRVRWVVERSISWLLRFKRLGLRYERTLLTLRPLLTLGRPTA